MIFSKCIALILSVLMSSYTVAAFTDQCTYKQLPIFTGGLSDDFVNCIAFDPINKLIVYGGNTTSVNFAPAANDHAFLIAIDYDGNWMWGKFFYNVSYALSDISGCQMASDGLSLTLFGISNSQPVIMDINTIDGSINKFLSVEWTAMTSKNVPVFST